MSQSLSENKLWASIPRYAFKPLIHVKVNGAARPETWDPSIAGVAVQDYGTYGALIDFGWLPGLLGKFDNAVDIVLVGISASGSITLGSQYKSADQSDIEQTFSWTSAGQVVAVPNFPILGPSSCWSWLESVPDKDKGTFWQWAYMPKILRVNPGNGAEAILIFVGSRFIDVALPLDTPITPQLVGEGNMFWVA
jgi:hypothetical protein